MALTEAQKLMRRTGIGSSDIGAICGLSTFRSPIDVWQEKVNGVFSEETPAMKRGRILESAIADWYAEESGAQLEESPTIRSKPHQWALATPDRIATKDDRKWVVELKTAGLNSSSYWGEAGTDQVPPSYMAQVAWEMMVTDLHYAELAVLIAGDDFRVYRLPRDPELEGMLLDAGEKFFKDYIVSKKPPPPDGTQNYVNFVKRQFPSSQGSIKVAEKHTEEYAYELKKLRETLEPLEERERELKSYLQLAIGNADGIKGSFGQITWKSVKGRANVDWKAVATELGADDALVKKYTYIGDEHRRFLPKFNKDK